MSRFLTLFLMSILFFSTPSFASDDVPRISIDELKSKIESGADILIFDVRGAIAGKKVEQVIKGAIRVPVIEIYSGKALPEDKDKEIILYCT